MSESKFCDLVYLVKGNAFSNDHNSINLVALKIKLIVTYSVFERLLLNI